MASLESNLPETSPVASVHLLRAGLFLIAGIIAGAFGAHAMKAVLDPVGLSAFTTAAQYLLFMGASVMGAAASGRASGLGWVEFGTVLFSGSIFLLLLLKHLGWPHAILGPVTPIGGTFMIGGWVRWVWVLIADRRG